MKNPEMVGLLKGISKNPSFSTSTLVLLQLEKVKMEFLEMPLII